MLLSHKHRFIFIHIYKVAGTSVTRALQSFIDKPEKTVWSGLLFGLGLGRRAPASDVPGHVRAVELKRRLPREVFDTYFKFAFVRNPWDWQVSLYSFALQTKSHKDHCLVASMSGFEEYLEWRLQNKVCQLDFLTDENRSLMVDFVGKLETIDQDFARICQHLGIRAALPHLNKSAHRDYRSYYTPRTRRLIEDAFQEDIRFFGYSFDSLPARASA